MLNVDRRRKIDMVRQLDASIDAIRNRPPPPPPQVTRDEVESWVMHAPDIWVGRAYAAYPNRRGTGIDTHALTTAINAGTFPRPPEKQS